MGDVIKQNESEVEGDMLLVSDYILCLNTSQKYLKPDTCEALQYQVLYYMFIRSIYVTPIRYVTSGRS